MSFQPASNHSDLWSSRRAFILAATGAAVGLGNIWRFPYMAGIHGGSAFVLLYIFFVVLIGLPIMVAEILIGKSARSDPVSSLYFLSKESHSSPLWRLVGVCGAVALLLILSFYSVVSGWSLAYLSKSIMGAFHHQTPQYIQNSWHALLSNPLQVIFWHFLFMLLTAAVVIQGVQQGLERATKFMMPSLYFILFFLCFYAYRHGDFYRSAQFLFSFNLHDVTPGVVISALGHAFFTLALGAGAMLMYGSYVPDHVNIVKSVICVAILDVLVAILSGMAIFPLVFAHGLSPSSGPGLMFVTLPIAFSHVPYGSILSSLFFLLLLFAACTSSINLIEPLVVMLQRFASLSRTKSTLLVSLLAWVIGLCSALSFNVFKDVHFLGHFSLFDLATNIPTDILLPIGGIGFSIFAGWVMKRRYAVDSISPGVLPVWFFLVRYVAPVAVFIVFLSCFF